MRNIISTDSPLLIRAMADNPHIRGEELYKTEAVGHTFSAGEKCILTGLVDFPEYNGDEVIISSIREPGPHGRAYYVKGRIERHCNWVYEYRLIKKSP